MKNKKHYCGTKRCKICKDYYEEALNFAKFIKERENRILGTALEKTFETLWLNHASDFDIIVHTLGDYFTPEYNQRKADEIELKKGDVVEMDYQKAVYYFKGYSKSKEKASDGKPFALIHHDWDAQPREYFKCARQRLRLVGR